MMGPRLSSPSRLAAPAALVAAGAALLVAGPAEARTHEAEVRTAPNAFTPASKTLRAGDKVRFTWDGGGLVMHDVGVASGPQSFKSPLMSAGTYTTPKLRRTGRYALVCTQHPEMTMTLRVKRARRR